MRKEKRNIKRIAKCGEYSQYYCTTRCERKASGCRYIKIKYPTTHEELMR